ncbi:MAG: energy transducer TonB [Proteobacteria bacterium]|nr:MAG: energy transducer TonB [Pseudomonadota bacterium]
MGQVVVAAHQSTRMVAGATIALLHAALFYGLLHMHARSSAEPSTPAVVRFVGEVTERVEWQPPEVDLVPPEIVASAPQLPPMVMPLARPAERAISLPAQPARSVEPTPARQPDRSAPVEVSSVEYLREPAPRYPPQSRRLREQGLVVLRVLIDEAGKARRIEIQSSSGYARLDAAAREAVERAAFRPYIENGAPRQALVLIPIEFSLQRGSA